MASVAACLDRALLRQVLMAMGSRPGRQASHQITAVLPSLTLRPVCERGYVLCWRRLCPIFARYAPACSYAFEEILALWS